MLKSPGGTVAKPECPDLTPDQLNQNLLGWDPGVCIFLLSPQVKLRLKILACPGIVSRMAGLSDGLPRLIDSLFQPHSMRETTIGIHWSPTLQSSCQGCCIGCGVAMGVVISAAMDAIVGAAMSTE